MAFEQFEKLFQKIHFHSKNEISLLSAEALKAQTNGERLRIIAAIFKSTSKSLISLCLCDSLIKSSNGNEYLKIFEKLMCDHFPKFYHTADKLTKTKIRALHDTWVNILSV